MGKASSRGVNCDGAVLAAAVCISIRSFPFICRRSIRVVVSDPFAKWMDAQVYVSQNKARFALSRLLDETCENNEVSIRLCECRLSDMDGEESFNFIVVI
jgi:hypothetical protein